MSMPIWTRGVPKKAGLYWCVPDNKSLPKYYEWKELPIMVKYDGEEKGTLAFQIMADDRLFGIRELGMKALFLKVTPPTSFTVLITTDIADSVTTPIEEVSR